MTDTAALTISNLRVDYGELTAVDDLSLTLEPGEIFGLAGPNGAGKTSTIRVLATLLEPTYGDVHVFGHDLFEEPEAVHSRIGYMPDLAPVIPNLRVWEFLDLYAHSHGLGAAQRRERIDYCLERVKLTDKRNVYGRALSRGMMQRVVLAKTLVHDPKLLLLDEPASGMDPIARREMRLILQDLARGGASIIVSSHILGELSDMCTSVGIMHRGKLLRHGPIGSGSDAVQVESAEVQVELIAAVNGAATWLEAHARVDAIRVDGQRLSFVLEGDKCAQAELLSSMIGEGFDVVRFSPGEPGIESLLVSLVSEDEQ